jgi:hypothetical protein
MNPRGHSDDSYEKDLENSLLTFQPRSTRKHRHRALALTYTDGNY